MRKHAICIVFFAVISYFCSAAFAEGDSEFKKGCRTCHGEKLAKWDAAKIPHFPYAGGSCESCHSSTHKQFTGKTNELCAICHDFADEKIKKAHFGSDISGTNCLKCHLVHGSDQKKLLKESVHMPFASGMCGACHDLDAQSKTKTKDDMKKVCLTCHGSLVSEKEKVRHPAFDMLECTNCHSPHTTDEAKLLNKSVSETCLECHDKAQAEKHPYDVVPSLKITGDKKAEWANHGGIVTCVSCHKPHASEIPFLLKEQIGGGKLCYNCHEQK